MPSIAERRPLGARDGCWDAAAARLEIRGVERATAHADAPVPEGSVGTVKVDRPVGLNPSGKGFTACPTRASNRAVLNNDVEQSFALGERSVAGGGF